MAEVIPNKYRDLFDKKIFAGLVTLMPDGSPQVTPVWIDFDGEHVLFNTAAGRQKDKNPQRDGRVALMLVDPENPYRYLEVRGQVAERTMNGRISHQQAGEEISEQGRLSLPPARRAARAIQGQAGALQLDGLIFRQRGLHRSKHFQPRMNTNEHESC